MNRARDAAGMVDEIADAAQAAVQRLAKRLYKLSGADGLAGTATAIQHYIKNSPDEISDRQSEALDDMKRIFRRG